jgi:predicted Zn-dependent peptidase
MLQSYLVLAYRTPPRDNKDSYALDIIDAILGRRSSGRMFDEIRNKRGLAYEVSVQYEALKTLGFFAVYAIADRKNLGKIVKIMEGEFDRLQELNASGLKEAKTYIEGDLLLENEDNLKRAEFLGFFNHASSVNNALNYLRKINKVPLGEVKRVARRYFNKKYTLVIIEEK